MKKHTSILYRGEAGSITVFFALIATLLVGAISYSLYIGQQVDKKIALQNAADSGAYAMATHASQGLNMISANNLALGASLHISASVAIVASYGTIIRMVTASATDIADLAGYLGDAAGAQLTEQLDFFQKDVWNSLAIVPSIFMRLSVGMTSYNKFLNKFWLFPAPVYNLEITRANAPDSVAIPLQRRAGLLNLGIPLMQYAGLKQTAPDDTFCQALRSSRDMSQADRDNPLLWLTGPVKTLVGDSMLGNVIDGVNWVISFANSKALANLGFIDCGYGLKSPLFKFFKSIPNSLDAFLAAPTVAYLAYVDSTNAISAMMKCKRKWGVDPVCNARKILARDEIYSVTLPELQNKRYVEAAYLRQIVEKMREKSEGYECEGITGYIKVATSNETHECINIAAIDTRCPILIYMHGDVGRLIVAKGIIGDYINKYCGTYRHWKELADSVNEKELKDNGWQIVDFGKQAKAMVNGVHSAFGFGGSYYGPALSYVKKEDLGFLYPDKFNNSSAFEASVRFVNIAALPIRTTNHLPVSESCQNGNKTVLPNGKEYCDVVPLIGVAKLTDDAGLSSFNSAERKKLMEQLNLSQGGLADLVRKTSTDVGALRGTWSRAQWVVSEAHVMHRPNADDPKSQPAPEMRTFWPAWRAELRQPDVNFASGVFSKLTRNAQVGGAMAKMANP